MCPLPRTQVNLQKGKKKGAPVALNTSHLDEKQSVTVVEWSAVALNKLRSLFPEQTVPCNVQLVQEEWSACFLFGFFCSFKEEYRFSWAKGLDSGSFTMAFDKDAFGFCNPETRDQYAESVSRLVNCDGCWLLWTASQFCRQLAPKSIIYMEVKERKADKEEGPPFHISEEIILKHWKEFEIVKRLGVVLEYVTEGYFQMGYVLRKK